MAAVSAPGDVQAADRFTSFHFAFATVEIVRNLGFEAATPKALEILTEVMSRYFDVVCSRLVTSAQKAERERPTVEDCAEIFKQLGISIDELFAFGRQVRGFASITELPAYPVEEFADAPNEHKLLLADPFDEYVPTVEEAEETFRRLVHKRADVLAAKPTADSDSVPIPDSGFESMRMEDDDEEDDDEEDEVGEVVWRSKKPFKLPDFSAMSGEQLGVTDAVRAEFKRQADERAAADIAALAAKSKAKEEHKRQKAEKRAKRTAKRAAKEAKKTGRSIKAEASTFVQSLEVPPLVFKRPHLATMAASSPAKQAAAMPPPPPPLKLKIKFKRSPRGSTFLESHM